jgi:TolA-binding protein
MEQYENALAEYREYIQKYSDGKYVAICIYQMGNCYWAQEDFANAKGQYEKVVGKYPDFSETCSAKGFLGYCLDQLNQWQKARQLYRDVLNDRQCQGEARKFAKEQLDANLVKH